MFWESDKIESYEQFRMDVLPRFERYFSCNTAKPLRIRLFRWAKSRTIDQNSTLFWAYGIISKSCGYRVNDLHHLFLCEFFGIKTVEIRGKVREFPIRTTTTKSAGESEKLSSAMFSELFQFGQEVASTEWGVYVADPDPQFKTRLQAQIEKETKVRNAS